jgi:hypothetical protein
MDNNADATPGEYNDEQVVEGDDDDDGDGDAFSDKSRIMMYSPLMQSISSLVELAETEFMPRVIPVVEENTKKKMPVSNTTQHIIIVRRIPRN